MWFLSPGPNARNAALSFPAPVDLSEGTLHFLFRSVEVGDLAFVWKEDCGLSFLLREERVREHASSRSGWSETAGLEGGVELTENPLEPNEGAPNLEFVHNASGCSRCDAFMLNVPCRCRRTQQVLATAEQSSTKLRNWAASSVEFTRFYNTHSPYLQHPYPLPVSGSSIQ